MDTSSPKNENPVNVLLILMLIQPCKTFFCGTKKMIFGRIQHWAPLTFIVWDNKNK